MTEITESSVINFRGELLCRCGETLYSNTILECQSCGKHYSIRDRFKNNCLWSMLLHRALKNRRALFEKTRRKNND